MKKTIFLVFAYSFICLVCHTQTPKTKNLPNYDREKLHFGCTLGVNSANFIIHLVKDFAKFDTLKTILALPSSGFNIGIVSEISLHELIKLRFIPDLSFVVRSIEYNFEGKNPIVSKRVIESYFIDFPVDLKLKSKRVNNFAGSVIVGMKYVMDLASKEDTKSASSTTATVKLKRNDIAYETGAGMEMYLPYFKFGIDLKLSIGMKNLLVNDNSIFSNPIDKLNSKVILVSFTFEG